MQRGQRPSDADLVNRGYGRRGVPACASLSAILRGVRYLRTSTLREPTTAASGSVTDRHVGITDGRDADRRHRNGTGPCCRDRQDYGRNVCV